MREEAGFLRVGGEGLFVVFCVPESPNGLGVVVCDPLGEEKLWAHRPLVSFARDMASRGFTVARFDYRGEGDSERSFEETDLESRIEDLSAVLEAVGQRLGTHAALAVVGLRFGGMLAALVAARFRSVQRLVIWDPILDGDAYAQSLLRINLAGQLAAFRKVVEGRDRLLQRLADGGTINIEGYALSGPFFGQISAIRLSDTLSDFPGRVLMLQSGAPDGTVRDDLAAVERGRPNTTVRVVAQQPFWKETKSYSQRSDGFAPSTLEWMEASQ